MRSDEHSVVDPENDFDSTGDEHSVVVADANLTSPSSSDDFVSQALSETANADQLPQRPPPPSSSSSCNEALAKAISSLIGSAIRDFDSKAEDASRSQDQLSSAIDRLTRELDQLLEDAPLPFIMQHAAKISGVRKRVLSLNSLLKSIQRRLDSIDRVVSLGTQHG